MPVVYEIDQVRGLIRTRCVGHVTIEEVIGHFPTLELSRNARGQPELSAHIRVRHANLGVIPVPGIPTLKSDNQETNR